MGIKCKEKINLAKKKKNLSLEVEKQQVTPYHSLEEKVQSENRHDIVVLENSKTHVQKIWETPAD